MYLSDFLYCGTFPLDALPEINCMSQLSPMTKTTKNPCAVCSKSVKDNQRGIFCDACTKWIHLPCTRLTQIDYKSLSQSSDSWFCHMCLESLFPFNSIEDEAVFLNCLMTLQHSNHLNASVINSVHQFNIVNRNKVVNKDIDPDSNFICNTASQSSYFSNDRFNDTMNHMGILNDNFSILHLNIRSLKKMAIALLII